VPMLPGRVEKLAVREGDEVVKGDIIATLKLNALQAKLAQANSVVSVAKSNLNMTKKGTRTDLLDMAQVSIKSAQNEYKTATSMLERAKKLFEQKAIGKARLERSTLAHNLAKDHLELTQKNLKMLKSGARPEELESVSSVLQGAKKMRDSVAALMEEKTQIATISGEVAKIYLHEGEIASIAYPIITIVDLTDQWVTLSVREDLLKKIKKGDGTEFYLPALDITVPATITHIAPLGDFATWRATSDSGSFDLKSFEITLTPLSFVKGMRPGMTARWTIR
ncbi:biotin/lipoyl-binding protein, partial [bacterium]|nr:biotin/lipoyl-binding protein [bacterium]